MYGNLGHPRRAAPQLQLRLPAARRILAPPRVAAQPVTRRWDWLPTACRFKATTARTAACKAPFTASVISPGPPTSAASPPKPKPDWPGVEYLFLDALREAPSFSHLSMEQAWELATAWRTPNLSHPHGSHRRLRYLERTLPRRHCTGLRWLNGTHRVSPFGIVF